MEYRKVVRTGNSWTVALPRTMCREMQLYPGDYVQLYYSRAGILLKKDNGPEFVRNQIVKPRRRKGGNSDGK